FVLVLCCVINNYQIILFYYFFFFQAEDGIRDATVTGVQTCALPIYTKEFGRDAGHIRILWYASSTRSCAATGRLPAGSAAGIRDAAEDVDGAFQRRSGSFEQDFCAEWNSTNAHRNHAAALWMVWGGCLDSGDTHSGSGHRRCGVNAALVSTFYWGD